jgi:glycosyltransferase involved in cell wall biosynthesis
MRIAWFTPFGPKSAVGEYSKHVTDTLAQQVDVDVWVSSRADLRATSLPIRLASDAVRDPGALDSADFVVYNLGDHYDYHSPIVEVSRLRSGIAILHDRTYQNLFREIWHRGDPESTLYAEKMESWYGDEGARVATGATALANWTDDLTVRFPLWEEAVVTSEGVAVHSRDHADTVRSSWAGPVAELFLPRYPTDAVPSDAARGGASSDRLLLLTVGYVNPNKRIEDVLHLLGRHRELADRVRYVVVGPCDIGGSYYGGLRELIDKYGLASTVEFLDYQPDDVLAGYMARADIFVNLRYPTLEGGSASLMRQLSLGKPVLAYDAGAFSEVPADAIARVEPLDADGLAEQLRRFVSDAGIRAAVGENGRRWTEERDLAAYVRLLLAFFDEVSRARPLLQLSDRVADELAGIETAPHLRVVERVAGEIATMRE